MIGFLDSREAMPDSTEYGAILGQAASTLA